MFRSALRPSPLGHALALALLAFWAILWFVFLFQILASPQTTARQHGHRPALARMVSGLQPAA